MQVERLAAAEGETGRVRARADSALASLAQQLTGLQDSLVREQRRLTALLHRKETKIVTQRAIIHKMGSLIEMQRLQLELGDSSAGAEQGAGHSLPTIVVEDTARLRVPARVNRPPALRRQVPPRNVGFYLGT